MQGTYLTWVLDFAKIGVRCVSLIPTVSPLACNGKTHNDEALLLPGSDQTRRPDKGARLPILCSVANHESHYLASHVDNSGRQGCQLARRFELSCFSDLPEVSTGTGGTVHKHDKLLIVP